MSLSAFGYAVLAVIVGAPIAATIAAVRAKRLFWEDLGIVVLPAVAFFFVGFFRKELHIGWALLLWPIIIGVLSLYAFAAKVLLDRRSEKERLNSRLFAASCTTAAVVTALVTPPWYD